MKFILLSFTYLSIIYLTNPTLSCERGMTTINGKCAPCPMEGCKFCTSEIALGHKCSICDTGYYITYPLFEDPKCTKCPDHCFCTAPVTDFCYCELGYYWDNGTNSCRECTSKFMGCDVCDPNGNSCTQCKDSYYIKDGSCITPIACGEGCEVCETDSTTECSVCKYAYTLTDTKTCLSCADPALPFGLGCEECTLNTCKYCKEGYTTDVSDIAKKVCKESTGDMLGCLLSEGDTCILCIKDWTRGSDGRCSQPIPNCGEYYADGACRFCSSNAISAISLTDFTLSVMYDQREGFSINTCLLDCTGVTIYYPNHLYWDAEETFCISGSKCPDGFYLTPDKNCFRCPLGCRACNLGSDNISILCSTCDEGYQHLGSPTPHICMPCNTGCSDCQTEPGKCHSCMDYFYMTGDGRCLPCGEGCLQCTDYTCIICKQGYVRGKSGVCLQCPTNCLYCKDEGYCVECPDGQYLENGGCKYCGLACLECLADKCAKCGYPKVFLMVDQGEYEPGMVIRGDECVGDCVDRVEGKVNGQSICRRGGGWCPDGYHENGHLYCVKD